MKFELYAKCKKTVWRGTTSVLSIFEENYKDKTTEWAVFCSSEPTVDETYLISGFIGKKRSQKFKDDNGQFGTEFAFTALSMALFKDHGADTQSHSDDEMRF